LAAVLAAAAVWEIRDPAQTSLKHHVQAAMWLSPALIGWLLGAYLRTRRLYVVELQERAERAERQREEQAAAAVASERARIARELHDIVAHNVSVMVVQAEAADEMLDRDEIGRVRAPVQRIQETGRSALTDMRRLLGLLRDADTQAALAPQPGIANLELLLAKMRDAGLQVDLRVDGTPTPLSPGVDLSAYRIVQEALTNALKHAGAVRVRVGVRYAGGALELEVSDDGTGGGQANGGGHGLVGMRERVALFGGELDAGPGPEGGFRVRARLPLEATA
jgi:signal transduction histidine kinase